MIPSPGRPSKSGLTPRPPSEGKPTYQRQHSSKQRGNSGGRGKRKSSGEVGRSREGYTASPLPRQSYSRVGSASSQSTASSLEGIGLSDELAKSLPKLSKQESFSKYDPLPPIQLGSTDLDNYNEPPPVLSMGRRKHDADLKPDGGKTKIKGGKNKEQENGPVSAKRSRPLYRKGAIFTKAKAGDQQAVHDSASKNVSPLDEQPKADKATNTKKKASKGDPVRLAFRLIDGQRIEETFRSSDTVQDLMTFLFTHNKPNKSKQYVLCSNEIPLKEYNNLKQTLAEACISDRMLLHLTDK